LEAGAVRRRHLYIVFADVIIRRSSAERAQERIEAKPRRQWLAAAHPLGTALRTQDGEGLFDGLDADGALRLRLADGSLRLIHAGDVFLI